MSVEQWTYLIVGLSFALYLYIGYRSRVRDTRGFYVAGRGVPPVANGAATAADWMSAASFISMAGLIATLGYDGAIYLLGWTGGYVLLALLLAPLSTQISQIHRARFCGRSLRFRWGAGAGCHRHDFYLAGLCGGADAGCGHCVQPLPGA
jgi:Na+(H+)/acetate symporter ActP